MFRDELDSYAFNRLKEGGSVSPGPELRRAPGRDVPAFGHVLVVLGAGPPPAPPPAADMTVEPNERGRAGGLVVFVPRRGF